MTGWLFQRLKTGRLSVTVESSRLHVGIVTLVRSTVNLELSSRGEVSWVSCPHTFMATHRYYTPPLFMRLYQDGARLDEDSTMLLLRQMMVIGCEPRKVGAMSTGSAPLDPIFWVLHSAFEKAQHILQLSPGYRDTYDFEWVDSGGCDEGVSGGKLSDPYPFTGW